MSPNLLKVFIAFGMTVLYFTGCARKQIIVTAYTPPLEERKVESLINKNGVFALALNPTVKIPKTVANQRELGKILIDRMQEALTSENYICIEPVYDWADIKLRMEVVDYHYEDWMDKEEGMHNIKSYLQVSFIATKGANDVLVKTYDSEDQRSARNKQQLPSQRTLRSDLAKTVVSLFIEDISPLQTDQLRELVAFPDGMDYLETYAGNGNFAEAVEAMEAYSGEKDERYHCNLAMFYEAKAGKSEKAVDMKKAKEHYQKCFQMGGSSTSLVEAKGFFDASFRQFGRLENQRRANKKCEVDSSVVFE